MRVLIVTDPLPAKDLAEDTTYSIVRELCRRGHEIWAVDYDQIWARKNDIYATAYPISPVDENSFLTQRPISQNLLSYHLVLIRKEPPFDVNYLYLTHLLEQIACRVPVSNDPRGIRDSNEKLVTLRFSKWIPDTLVTTSAKKISRFQDEIGDDLVIKPLNLKQGLGIILLKKNERGKALLLEKLTRGGKKTVLAQRFLKARHIQSDKRILLLNGEILTAFERHSPPDDFRSNLSQGGISHRTRITNKEKQMVRDMKSYLVREGLHFVGLDVMMGKLLEINVTCPAGISEAQALYSDCRPIQRWADFLEGLGAKKRRY